MKVGFATALIALRGGMTVSHRRYPLVTMIGNQMYCNGKPLNSLPAKYITSEEWIVEEDPILGDCVRDIRRPVFVGSKRVRILP